MEMEKMKKKASDLLKQIGDMKWSEASDLLPDTDVSDRFKRNALDDFLHHIVEGDMDIYENIDDGIQELADNDVPLYVPTLMEWVNEDVNHIYYIGEASREYDITYPPRLLSVAYFLALRELYYEFYHALEKISEGVIV